MMGGCASILDQDGALAVAPYRIDQHGLIVVKASVNQQGPFSFALDTGASISSVFDSLRDQMDIKPIPGRRAIVNGAVDKGEFYVLDVDLIAIYGEVWTDPTFV